MGILKELRETAGKIPAHLLFTEDKNRSTLALRENLIKQGARLFDEEYSRYFGLGKMLESEDPKDQYKAALTLNMLAKVQNLIEGYKAMGINEGVIQTSLGALAPRVLDVVRIFYPNQIATELVDIQPIDGQVGEIFVMKPRFSQALPAGTIGAVAALDEVFKTPSYYYASEVTAELIATGNGTVSQYTNSLAQTPVRKNSLTLTAVIGGVVKLAKDDGNGKLIGDAVNVANPNTINYTNGALVVSLSGNLTDGAQLIATYSWDSESSNESIRSLEFDIGTVPVQAKIHPIRFNYSVAAGLAAKAHLAVDVQDVLAEEAAQFLKVERDYKLVRLILANATAEASLNFVATPSEYFDRQSKYADIELKVNEGESLIQAAMGRGGVSWVLCGNNAANLFRAVKGFVPAPVTAPVGAHVVGYLRDSSVPVIKVPLTAVLDTNKYVIGYKGYMAGDAATILAEWIPVYFTPVFQSPTLKNEQGLMSMYDLFVNNAGYYRSGTISGYVA
jgi:hypothetical protein